MPAARCCISAWEDTSITTWVQPASAICESKRWSVRLSGVVRSAERIASPIMFWFVPMSPTFAWSVCSSSCFKRYVVVVLPLVPVTPITVI